MWQRQAITKTDFILLLTEYSNVNNITFKRGETVVLTSHNYPKNTYADSQWLISSNEANAIIVKFLDFKLAVGVSLSIGSGVDFSESDQLLKIGTPNIHVDTNDTVTIRESSIWIWFRTNDETARVIQQTEIVIIESDDSSEGSSVNVDSVPSVSGIKLDVKHGYIGKACTTHFTIIFLRRFSPGPPVSHLYQKLDFLNNSVSKHFMEAFLKCNAFALLGFAWFSAECYK